jgi:hypothetical protein
VGEPTWVKRQHRLDGMVNIVLIRVLEQIFFYYSVTVL